jgi:hypothetical protein
MIWLILNNIEWEHTNKFNNVGPENRFEIDYPRPVFWKVDSIEVQDPYSAHRIYRERQDDQHKEKWIISGSSEKAAWECEEPIQTF